MATRVTLNTVDGELVVDKVALEGDRPDRQAEARWLAEARSPHVVRLVAYDEPLIRTLHAGQTTLRTATLPPSDIAGLFLGLARALADLHGRGLVHGKITLDHVVVAPNPDGGARVVLCSPDGLATDHTVDLVGIGEMVERLLERWDEQRVDVPRRSDWERIRSQLRDCEQQITAQRVARWFAPLVVSAPPSDDAHAGSRDSSGSTQRHPSGRGIGFLVAFVVFAVGATVWNPLNRQPAATSATVTLMVDGNAFEVEGPIGAAVGAPPGCDPEAAVLYDDSTVWRFVPADNTITSLDGAIGRAEASVPGATELVYEDCALWAVGPAGRTELDRP